MRKMENAETNNGMAGVLLTAIQKLCGVISRDRYKFELIFCLAEGILFGCVTQTVYGKNQEWCGVVESYCAGFWQALQAVAPVTLVFLAALFAAAPFEYLRLLIYPAVAVRSMGLGALIGGPLQCGNLREMCFASLVILPYAAANCTICVYAGEYALGLRTAFNGENEGMRNNLILHALKMLLFYLMLAALSCAVFAASCMLFGVYFI